MTKIKTLINNILYGNLLKRHNNISFKENETGGIKYSLTDFFNIIDGDAFGGKQKWFHSKNPRTEGCGYVAIANCYVWSQYKNKKSSVFSKNEFKKIMRRIYIYKPSILKSVNAVFGLLSRKSLKKVADNFAKKIGTTVQYGNISSIKIKPKNMSEAMIIKKSNPLVLSIKNQVPVLILFYSGLKSPFGFHWITITSIQEIRVDNEIQDYWIGMSSWGYLYYSRLSEIKSRHFYMWLTFN